MELGLIEILQVIVFGIVEGITEWLPISSTGHMLLLDEFLPLQMRDSFKEMFFVVIQLGAIVAVVVIFWDRMFPFSFKKNEPMIKKDIFSMWFMVAVACIPSALGLILDDFLEQHFGNALTISIMLIVYGIAFIVVENWNKNRVAKVRSLSDITYKIAFIIGLFQVLAMIPGTSRSGATIIGALIIGVSRVAAAEFTFFLAVPTMVAASAFKILKFGFVFTASEVFALIIGMCVAFAVSIIVIKFLMSYIKKGSFKVFGYYRIILGIIVLLIFSF